MAESRERSQRSYASGPERGVACAAPYPPASLPGAFADPSADPARLFATFQGARAEQRDYRLASTARAYAQRLAGDAEAAHRDELVQLLDDLAIRNRYHCAQIIWDDERPRKLHLWPDGYLWGDVPPDRRSGALAARTYTVCGRSVDKRLSYRRALRGEWATHFSPLALLAHAGPAGYSEHESVAGDRDDGMRVCLGCAPAARGVSECFESEDETPPDWWFKPIVVESAVMLTDLLLAQRVESRTDLDARVAVAYRQATSDWLVRRLTGGGEATLRRLFETERREPGAPADRDPRGEYERLVEVVVGRFQRRPHEILSEADWRGLSEPYLPAAEKRASEAGAGGSTGSIAAEFRREVQRHIESLCGG